MFVKITKISVQLDYEQNQNLNGNVRTHRTVLNKLNTNERRNMKFDRYNGDTKRHNKTSID